MKRLLGSWEFFGGFAVGHALTLVAALRVCA